MRGRPEDRGRPVAKGPSPYDEAWRFHADRALGRDCDHRHFDRAVAAGRAGRARSGAADAVQKQHQAARAGAAQLPRHQPHVSAGAPGNRPGKSASRNADGAAPDRLADLPASLYRAVGARTSSSPSTKSIRPRTSTKTRAFFPAAGTSVGTFLCPTDPMHHGRRSRRPRPIMSPTRGSIACASSTSAAGSSGTARSPSFRGSPTEHPPRLPSAKRCGATIMSPRFRTTTSRRARRRPTPRM